MFPIHLHETCVSTSEALLTAFYVGASAATSVQDALEAVENELGSRSRASHVLRGGGGVLARSGSTVGEAMTLVTALNLRLLADGEDTSARLVELLNRLTDKALSPNDWAEVLRVQ
jgi:hypothetical protein